MSILCSFACWIAVLVFGILSLPAWADGILLPHPPHQPIAPLPELSNFSIKYHRVQVEINHPLVKTSVDQLFHNPTRQELEGTYLFPVPEGASLTGFAMDVDGRMTPATLLKAVEARKIYEEIVRQRIDPGLLEYAGQNLYKARVFPIPAQGSKRIRLSYDQVLPTQSNLHTYRYLLSTEKFSATPLANVSVSIRLKTREPLKSVYSPSHPLKVTRLDDYNALISYEAQQVKPDSDFELYYTTAGSPVGLSLFSWKETDQDGYFMLLGAPQTEWSQAKKQPRNLTLILDTSGSMSGEKLSQAKSALEFNLNQLKPEDHFHLFSFSDTVAPFSKAPLPATPAHIRKAIAHVRNLQATGGTDINTALLSALKSQVPPSGLNMLIFLTDGDPTVGETDFNRILKNVRSANSRQQRIFVFGVGFDVNIPFLDRLAQGNRGSSEFVRPEENIEVKVSNLFNRTSHPVLSDLRLSFSAGETYELYPRELPDLFKDSQLLIVGRYRRPGPVQLTLSGQVQGKPQQFRLSEQELLAGKSPYHFLPRLWATRKIGYLLDQIRLQGKNQELLEEVIRLSKEFGIITEYTSFLVRDDVDVRRPAGSSPMLREADQYLQQSLESEKGSWAISQSRNTQKLQQNTAPASSSSYLDESGQEQQVSRVRYVSQRAFYQKKGLWQDTTQTDNLPRLKIQRFSPLYFELARIQELRAILALGAELEFVHAGHLIQIGAQGEQTLTPLLKKKLRLP